MQKRKNKIITLYSKKGGVGKTTFSEILQSGLSNDKWFVITNDPSTYVETEEKTEYMEDIELYEDGNIIYDLGGFEADNVYDLLAVSDLVIIPTLLGKNSIVKATSIIEELKEIGQENILLIINQFKLRESLKYRQEIEHLKSLGVNYLFFSDSTLYINALGVDNNVYDYMNSSFNSYKNARENINNLLNYVSENLNLDIELSSEEQIEDKPSKKIILEKIEKRNSDIKKNILIRTEDKKTRKA